MTFPNDSSTVEDSGRWTPVTDPLVPVADGHTTLGDDDLEGLIPTYIMTRGELNDAEQRNITLAVLRRPPTPIRLLDDPYLRRLHKAMFGEVWRWAGVYRRLETNIGVDPTLISVEVRTLVDDARAWIDHATFEPDEIAARFHHRLVLIHPFENGNGRHGRLAADYLANGLGRPQFSWGAHQNVDTRELRHRYRTALQHGDNGDLTELLAFVRS